MKVLPHAGVGILVERDFLHALEVVAQPSLRTAWSSRLTAALQRFSTSIQRLRHIHILGYIPKKKKIANDASGIRTHAPYETTT